MNSGDLAGAVARLAAAVAADPGQRRVPQRLRLRAPGAAATARGRSPPTPRRPASTRASRCSTRARSTSAGRGAEAARQYEEILAKNPAAATVQEDFGRLLFRTGDYKNAVSHLQVAAQRGPTIRCCSRSWPTRLDQAGRARRGRRRVPARC